MKGDFGGKKNTNGFAQNKQNINKNGRPKRVLNSMLQYIAEKYGERPIDSEIIEMLKHVSTLSVQDLKEFVTDENIPAIVQAYGRLILTGDTKDFKRVQGAEIISDRLLGKPKQSIETEITTAEPITGFIIECIQPENNAKESQSLPYTGEGVTTT